MFKLSKERKVWWPVRLPVSNEAGEVSTTVIRAQFTLLKADELAAMRGNTLQQVQEGATATGSIESIIDRINAAERDMTARVAAHVSDWRGVVDQDSGDELPFTPEALALALEYADVRQAFSVALREASTGAAAKN